MQKEISFGNYKGKELIWIQIYKNDTTQYILKEPICKMVFDEDFHVYKDSTVRKFLLEDFIPNSFSNEELSHIVPYEKRFNDLVWLARFYDLKEKKLSVNRSIYNEKHAWWTSDHVRKTNEATWGALYRFGFSADVAKNSVLGVRPCIILNFGPM